MTAEDVRALLRQRVETAGSANAWARLNGVSHAYVLDTMARRRAPGPAILHALGLEKDDASYRVKESACGRPA
ncbi:hypothetical protein [Methylobacterium platani]|uniref:DNA-binding protein n=2 Tax=Methylobacterium platani TaxID=427683 RepID=A0A179S664_9HYPH|nr:hypothetical protein [Methylobacterium platani]KMO22318.1 hypothetical protein SQ03_00930 [Methylobacterium platani JCM 14648]OAS22543.1 hypothetical protein A5481_19310 [Methylobacterium platani]